MSTIGPAIPAHLLNRHGTNEEGHDTDSDSPVGPQIPIDLLNQADDDAEEEDYVPALPPDMVATRSAGSSTSRATTNTHGASGLAQAHSSYLRRHQLDDDDDDDDDVGPQPLPPGTRHTETDAVREFVEKEEKRRREVEEAGKPKTLKRDEWMLVPPSSSDLLGNLDPSKLTKARQFSRSSAPHNKSDTSLWTETPAERQQRLADEVSGKKRRAVNAEPVEEALDGKKKRRMDEEIRKGVDEYTHKIRGPSLIVQHGSTSKADDKQDESSGIWDHARDMSMGGRLMDDAKRKQLVREAGGLGDRFGTGKSGGFL